MKKYLTISLILLARLTTAQTSYDEPYRFQFYFSPQQGWMNDVNGVWYYEGVYHISYQANPHGLEWANTSPGHTMPPSLAS